MPNWGDPSFGNQFSTTGDNQDPVRQSNVYEFDPTKDTGTSWANRVWQQSTADYGRNNLNPYIGQNPNANSPFAKWYQSRYGTAGPTNVFSNDLVSNTPMTAQTVASQLKQMQQGTGAGAGPNGPGAGYTQLPAAQGQLQQIGNMLKDYSQGNKGAFSVAQNGMLGQMLNDPSFSTQVIMSALQGGTGGWGMNYMGNQLQNLSQQYYNDPAHQGPQAAGPFFNQALSLLGMGA